VSRSGWCWLVLDGGSSSSAGWVGVSCVREMSGGVVRIEYLLHKDEQQMHVSFGCHVADGNVALAHCVRKGEREGSGYLPGHFPSLLSFICH